MNAAPLEKIPLLFYKNMNGGELVREWLKALPEPERHGERLIGATYKFARQPHRPGFILHT